MGLTLGLAGCLSDEVSNPRKTTPAPIVPVENRTELKLQVLLREQNILPVDVSLLNLPSIDQSLPQLGKLLFYTKNLGAEQSTACVSCHHPNLGGGDDLSLPIGVAAVNQFNYEAHNLLGHGRFNSLDPQNLPSVPRNSPTIFNLGLNTQALFWDGRVERLQNGSIATPDSPPNADGTRLADATLATSATLATAQAKFPVTSHEEMRGVFLIDSDNDSLRQSLSQRFDNSDNEFFSTWPQAFELVYGDTEITYNRIAEAIGEYERSMVFIESPWQAYLNGETDAITERQKQGAIAFFTPVEQGGAGCGACHNGPTLSDNQYHLVAYPQIGEGKGDTEGTSHYADFGREQVSGNIDERYHFKTPSLLNILETAPYGHAGAYNTLQEVVTHYNDPEAAIKHLFNAQNEQAFDGETAPICNLPQYADIIEKNNLNCSQAFTDAYENSLAVSRRLQQAQNNTVAAASPLTSRKINNHEIQLIVAFLEALTDPCVSDSDCMSAWNINSNDIASFPDDMWLLAVDENDIEL